MKWLRRPRLRKLMVMATVVLAATALWPTPAGASWSGGFNASPADWAAAAPPAVAADRVGGTRLAWVARDRDDPLASYRVQVRRVGATGGLGSLLTISPAGESSSFPVIASDDDGDSIVAWQWFDNLADRWRVKARRISRTGELGPVLTLSSPDVHADLPAVAVDPHGRAIVVWQQAPTASDPYEVFARRIGVDSIMGSPFWLGAPSENGMDVAMDRRGNATVVWTNGNDLYARRITPDSMLSLRNLALSVGGTYYWAHVDVDADGDAVIGFRVKQDEKFSFWVRRYLRTGTVGTARRVSPTDQTKVVRNQLAIDQQGDAILVWTRRVFGDYPYGFKDRLYARQYTAAGELKPMAKLGDVDEEPAVTLDDDGNGALAYQIRAGQQDRHNVLVRAIGRDGVLGAPRQLSALSANPVVECSPNGRITAVWVHQDQYRVQYAVGP